MASHLKEKCLAYKAAGAISRGMAVKPGADRSHVAKATAATDKIIGLAISTTENAEETIEVAHPGGGAVALLGDTVSAGDLLTADANGKLIATTTANNKIIAQALEDGVLNDLIAVNVIVGNY